MRNFLSLGDQFISSITNLLGIFVVASALDSNGFGQFSIVYTGLTLFVGVARGYFGIPLSLSAGTDIKTISNLYNSSISSILLLALPMMLVIALVGFISGASGGSNTTLQLTLMVAFTTPIAVMQDVSRFYSVAINQPQHAFISDAIWLIGIIALWLLQPETFSGIALLWIGSILLSFCYLLFRFRPKVFFRAALRLLKPGRGVRESTSFSVLLSNGTSLLVGIIVGSIYGLPLAGSIRGAGTLFGPVNTLISFLDFGLLSTLSRQKKSRTHILLLSSLALSLGAIAWWIVLLILPQNLGEAILGDTWAGTRYLLPVTGVEYLLLVIVGILNLTFKLYGNARAITVTKVISSITILAGVSLSSAFLLPPRFIAVALAIGALSGLVFGLIFLVKSRDSW